MTAEPACDRRVCHLLPMNGLTRDRFIELLNAVTTAAIGDDTALYMDAWEVLVAECGFDPFPVAKAKPAPSCTPLIQWGEVTCRLHGTAIARDIGRICTVTGEPLVWPGVDVIPASEVRVGEPRRFYHRNDIDEVRAARDMDDLDGPAHVMPLLLARGTDPKDWFAVVPKRGEP